MNIKNNVLSPAFAFLAALTLFMTSCQDVVEVDLSQDLKRIVVEGHITDKPNYRDTIKVSYNNEFYDETGVDHATNSTVIISDDQGNIDTLTEVKSGSFITSLSYRGVPGRSYSLNVFTADGNHYFSDPSFMEQVPEIDSIYIRETNDYYKELGWPEAIWGDNRYQIHIDFLDNETIGNVYGWNVWKNDTNYTDKNRLFLARDDFFGQDPAGEYWENLITFDYDLIEGDSVYIEQITVSLEEFDFRTTLSNSESSSAFEAFFGTTPAPVESNIHNANNENELEIGFFGAHSVVSASVVIPALPQ